MKRMPIIGLATILLTAAIPFASFAQCVPPVIDTEPVNTKVCIGGSADLAVSASGTSVTYRWQVDEGTGFSDIANGATYNGATTAELEISGATITMDGYDYRCIVDGACTPSDTSIAVNLDVQAPPVITVNPGNAFKCEGDNATFSLTATGDGLTYQWQVLLPNSGFWNNISDGGIYSGTGTPVLTLTGVTTAQHMYKYRCLVSNVCTEVYSSLQRLEVRELPNITTQPVNSTVCVNKNTTYSVVATGTDITYQWEVNDGSGFVNVANNTMYSGATTNTLYITGVTLAMDTYRYRCVVSGVCNPSVTSTARRLFVEDMPAISAQPANSTVCDGVNTSFSVTASGINIAYQWQVNTGSGFADISNGGIYSGATTATLTLTAPTTAVTGYRYRCKVSNVCTTLNSSAVDLVVNARPDITGQPGNSTICEGSNTSFTVANSGTGITYKWQVNTGSGFADITNGGVYSNATTATLNITGATVAMSGYIYRCILDNGNCTKNSGNATLTVNTLPNITAQPIATATCSGGNTSFSITATGTVISYQWQVNDGTGYTNIANGGIYSGATTATLALTAATGTVNNFNYRCVVSGTCTPEAISSGALLTIHELPAITKVPANSTVCTGVNTSFSVVATGAGLNYQWQVDNGSGYTNVINGGIYSGANTNKLDLTAPTAIYTGYKYRCVVSGTCAPSVTSGFATLVVNDVEVMTETGNTSICEGSNATFSMTVQGTALSYQWQVNDGTGYINITAGPAYTGETTNTLTVNIPDANMNGYTYRCIVNGICTQDVTTGMAMEVKDQQEISKDPVDVVAKEGSNVTFDVEAHGYKFYYYWQASTDKGQTFVTLTNNANYSGVSTNTLQIHNVSTAQTGYSYRCVVREIGGCGFAEDKSELAYLTVESKLAVDDVSKNGAFGLEVYPNPVSGSSVSVKLNAMVPGNLQVRVINSLGIEVQKQEAIQSQGSISVDVATLPAGIYTLYVSDKTQAISGTVRFTKQ